MASLRRLLVTLLALVVLLAACGGDDASDQAADTPGETDGELPFEGQELVVTNWNDYGSDIPWAVEAFEEATGATVTHQYFTSEEELLSLLRQGGVGQVDVALPNLAYIGRAIDEGLVQPIEVSRLEHYEQLYPQLRQQGDLESEGEQYGVPWMWGSTALAYDTTAFDEVTSWDALWDPANAGRVAFFDDAPTAIQTSALHLGQDPFDPDLEAVREDLLALKENTELFWASADDWLRSFSSDSVELGNLWSGLAGTQLADGDPIAYVVPEEGAPGWLDSWTIVEDAPNPDLAYAFIDYMISQEFQSRWAQDADRSSPAPANEQAAQGLPEDVAERIGSDPQALETLVLQRGLPEETLQEWTRLWQEVKAG